MWRWNAKRQCVRDDEEAVPLECEKRITGIIGVGGQMFIRSCSVESSVTGLMFDNFFSICSIDSSLERLRAGEVRASVVPCVTLFFRPGGKVRCFLTDLMTDKNAPA